MSKIYGYARISRKEQSIERQIRNIKAENENAILIQEAYTGTKVAGRKEFEKLLSIVRAGDTIIFDSVSRMSRNASEGFEIYNRLFNAGVELVFLKEQHINTKTYREALERQISASAQSGDKDTDELINAITDAINRYMMRLAERQIMIAFAQSEKEVADLHQRTAEGMMTAKLNGKRIGAQKGVRIQTKKSIAVKEQIRRYSKAFNGQLNDADTIKLIAVARNTYYKYKSEMMSEEREN